jgi:hypothetical protein
MRKVAQDIADELGMQSPFSATDLIAAAQATWGAQIHLVPFRQDAIEPDSGTTGVCRYAEGIFYIYYYADGSLLQRERIIFHELGHMLVGDITPKNPAPYQRDPLVLRAEEMLAEAFAEAMAEIALFGHPSLEGEEPSRRDQHEPYSRFIRAVDR